MVGSRTATALVGLAASLAITGLAWWLFDSLFVFLILPFLPFLFRRRDRPGSVRECPTCGYRTGSGEYEYCPRDGTELVERRG